MKVTSRFLFCISAVLFAVESKAAIEDSKVSSKCSMRVSGVEYKNQLPSHFVLAPVCKNAVGASSVHSVHWLFLGRAKIVGYLVYRSHPEIDETSISLMPNQAARARLPIGVSYLDLPESTLRQQTRIPNANKSRSSCWRAPAIVEVIDIKHINDDTDSSGSFPIDFKVLNLGRWSVCGE